MKPAKEPKKPISVQTRPAKGVKYKIYSQGESSFGYWIIPMIILLILGLLYIGFVFLIKSGSLDSDNTKTQLPSIKIDNPLSNSNLFENRLRAGTPIDLNSTSWGKQIPITPPPKEE